MDKEKFLKLISMIESSGGKNFNHKKVQSGVQEGDEGIGKYGLMNNTVQELINRERRGMAPHQEEYYTLRNKPSEEVKQYLESNPKAEDMFAKQLADKVGLQDPDKAAYMWNMGHNINREKISDDQLDTSPYVDKFRKLKESLAQEE